MLMPNKESGSFPPPCFITIIVHGECKQSFFLALLFENYAEHDGLEIDMILQTGQLQNVSMRFDAIKITDRGGFPMNEIKWNFSGKTALVTGGTRGIGCSVVKKLSRLGAKVYFTYSQSVKLAEDLLKECNTNEENVFALQCNLAIEEDVDRLLHTFSLSSSIQIDYLVHNAGIIADSPLYLMTNQQWEEVLQVNLGALFCLSRSLIRSLIKSSGSVVTIASVSGIFGTSGQVNYSAAKAGVIGLSKALSKEVGVFGVRVNCVAPGFIETDMLNNLTVEQREQFYKGVSLRRFGNPDEVADPILFLLSDAASYITGEVLVIDGGIN